MALEAVSYTRLTLALDIIRKISDGPMAGFHELGIIKHQITLGDRISLAAAPTMALRCAHPKVPEDARNICWQAIALLQRECGLTDNASIHIDKQIPVEGGLAGGSTNAATVLMLGNELWQLGLSRERLCELGRMLGQDVPFYFYGGTAFDSEATGVVRPLDRRLEPLWFVLVVPPFGVSTADAYRQIEYGGIGASVDATSTLESVFSTGGVLDIAPCIHNDFELSVFPLYDRLKKMKKQLLSYGAEAAFMSGSGSTMVALASSESMAAAIAARFEGARVVHSL